MLNRRKLLAAAAATTVIAGFRSGYGAQKQKLNIACVGVHNRGETNATVMIGENMVALCDVDDRYLTPFIEQHYPKAKPYVDWREMLEKEKIDAVVVSTPNHTHANIALAAIKKGLHVYIESPLAHTFEEVGKIEAAAKDKGVVAWMGNQYHASSGYQRAIELLKAGIIGPVKEVHAWTMRPLWKQGFKRPDEGTPIPTELNWELWLGPAPQHGYSSFYHPVGWRGWWDFGGGALADMGPHLLDPVCEGLKLVAPTSVAAQIAPDANEDSAPSWSKVVFEFPARDALPPLTLNWYDGPSGPRPDASVLGTTRAPQQGVMCLGERGKLFIPDLGGEPVIRPNIKTETIEEPERALSLNRGHHLEWLDACRADKPDHARFSQAARVTQLCHLGNIAVRSQKKLAWDAEKLDFTGDQAANDLLKRAYRPGWELPT